jgi:hypothetical protein
VYGEIRKYTLDTPIELLLGMIRHSKDFEIIEYKEETCEQ